MLPSQLTGIYSDVEELLSCPAEVVLKAILSSNYLHFSDSAPKIFSECITQSKQRLGEKRSAELISEVALQKLRKKRLRAEQTGKSTTALASDLLRHLIDAGLQSCPDNLKAYDELEASCAEYYPSFVIAVDLASKSAFEFVPLSVGPDELHRIQAIQLAVADRVWRLILSDPLRLVSGSEDFSIMLHGFLSLVSPDNRKILRGCIHRWVHENDTHSGVSRLLILLDEL